MISKEKTLLFMKLVEDDLKVADEQQGAEASLLSWLSSGITDEELTDLSALIDYGRNHYHLSDFRPDLDDLDRIRSDVSTETNRQGQTAAIIELLHKGVNLTSYLRYSLPLLSDKRTAG